jgi:hypothetical protein
VKKKNRHDNSSFATDESFTSKPKQTQMHNTFSDPFTNVPNQSVDVMIQPRAST